MNKIAFVTSTEQPDFSSDDLHLVKRLESRGISAVPVPWDSANVDWSDYNLILLRSCWNYYKKIEEFYKWLYMIKAAECSVFNDIDTILWNLDKVYLRELEEKGINIPDSIWIEKDDDYIAIQNIIAKKDWKKAVLKPRISAGSFMTTVATLCSLSSSLSLLGTRNYQKGIIVQEFAEEILVEGELSFIFFERDFSHAVLKRPKSGDFRVQSQFGGTVEKYFPTAVLLTQVREVLNAIKLYRPLYTRIDGFISGSNFVLMEVELIEPCLFFAFNENSADVLADKLCEKLANF